MQFNTGMYLFNYICMPIDFNEYISILLKMHKPKIYERKCFKNLYKFFSAWRRRSYQNRLYICCGPRHLYLLLSEYLLLLLLLIKWKWTYTSSVAVAAPRACVCAGRTAKTDYFGTEPIRTFYSSKSSPHHHHTHMLIIVHHII